MKISMNLYQGQTEVIQTSGCLRGEWKIMKDAITANEDWWELLRHCPQSLVLNRRECPPPIIPRVGGGGARR